MAYMIHDIVGLAAAIVLALPLFILPAYALAWQFDLFAVRTRTPSERFAYSLLIAYATLPAIQSIGGRFLGLRAMAALSLLLAALAVFRLRQAPLPKMPRVVWLMLSAGFVALAALWVDVSLDGKLYPTLLIIDLVKHAATVRSIVETGTTPPIDPFFLRDQATSYYYFFYTPAALIEMLSGGWVDSRSAVGGLVFWTGLAVVTLAQKLLDRSGFLRAGRAASPGLLIALMLAGGLQLFIVAPLVFSFGWPWPGQLGWIRDDLASWPVSMIWVPHHLSGMIASWVGFLALIEAQSQERGTVARWTHVALAGIAFASACGLSTWVTMGAIATLAVWTAVELYHRRWQSIALFAAAGVIALAVAAPHLLDLVRNRSIGGFPVAFEVRMFVASELLVGSLGWVGQNLVRLLFLPLHYVMAAGIFFAGAIAFWRSRLAGKALANPVASLIAYSAIASLFVGSFFQSVVVNNDLGWRVVLFVQLSALLWTAAYVEPLWQLARKSSFARVAARTPRPLLVLLMIGYAGVAYDLVATRLFSLMGRGVVINPRDPAADFEAREVYGWINRNLGSRVIVQHNPDTERALGYGLYGRQRTALADRHNALLFGPSHDDVDGRMNAIAPLFNAELPAAAVARTLSGQKVDTVVISSADPVWKANAAWVFATPALYQTPHMRVLAVRDLKDKP